MEILIKEIFYTEPSGFKNINEVVIGNNYCQHLNSEFGRHTGIGQTNIETEEVLRNCKFPVLIFPYMQCDVDYDMEDVPYETYSEEYNEERMYFCPKCGEKIEIKVVESEDVTEKVTPIIEKLQELEQKRHSYSRFSEICKLHKEFMQIMGIDQQEQNNFITPYFHDGPIKRL